jgi:hypothetical protein
MAAAVLSASLTDTTSRAASFSSHDNLTTSSGPSTISSAIGASLPFTLVGVLTFVVHPNGTALKAQFAGYLVVGAGMLAWALFSLYPGTTRYRARALPARNRIFAETGSRDRAAAIVYAHRHRIG